MKTKYKVITYDSVSSGEEKIVYELNHSKGELDDDDHKALDKLDRKIKLRIFLSKFMKGDFGDNDIRCIKFKTLKDFKAFIYTLSELAVYDDLKQYNIFKEEYIQYLMDLLEVYVSNNMYIILDIDRYCISTSKVLSLGYKIVEFYEEQKEAYTESFDWHDTSVKKYYLYKNPKTMKYQIRYRLTTREEHIEYYNEHQAHKMYDRLRYS